jgi:fumarate hydratase subunit beta
MEYRLNTPLSLASIVNLMVGDVVWLSGIVYTARDKAHAIIRKRGSPISLQGAAVYHCGPLICGGRVLSAGPTTSGRLARYTAEMVGLGVRAILGKGGLPGESPSLRDRCVYLAYPGGCGAVAAKHLQLRRVHLEDLGMAEAIWELEASDFGPLVVAMDSQGGDLYRDVRDRAKLRLGLER